MGTSSILGWRLAYVDSSSPKPIDIEILHGQRYITLQQRVGSSGKL
jgi:hypothetical protein